MGDVVLMDERVTFSPVMPQRVNQFLQAAVAATHKNPLQAEKLFLKAQKADRSCLQTYFALYKFYFHHKRFNEAEKHVMLGLEEAARQGGFPSDFRRLVRESFKWNLYANDIGLFYLYTLKALSFIKLRQNQMIEAQILLSQLKILDPDDISGASVIMDLASGLHGE